MSLVQSCIQPYYQFGIFHEIIALNSLFLMDCAIEQEKLTYVWQCLWACQEPSWK